MLPKIKFSDLREMCEYDCMIEYVDPMAKMGWYGSVCENRQNLQNCTATIGKIWQNDEPGIWNSLSPGFSDPRWVHVISMALFAGVKGPTS